MTLENARTITELEIVITPCHEGWVASGRHPEQQIEAAFGSGPTEGEALLDLVEMNWRRVCAFVFKRQSWKCADCGKIKPLQGHHTRRRSHGRKDLPETTTGLCAACHDAREGR